MRDFNGPGSPPKPTDQLPRSPGKVAILSARAGAGESLFTPPYYFCPEHGDAKFDGVQNVFAARDESDGITCGPARKKTSQYRGVSWHAHTQLWRAQRTINGRQETLGYFESEEAAYTVYCLAATVPLADLRRRIWPQQYRLFKKRALRGLGKQGTTKRHAKQYGVS